MARQYVVEGVLIQETGTREYVIPSVLIQETTGGTTFTQALAGSITPTGALTESYRVFKSLAGSITMTGALTAVYLAGGVVLRRFLAIMGVGS